MYVATVHLYQTHADIFIPKIVQVGQDHAPQEKVMGQPLLLGASCLHAMLELMKSRDRLISINSHLHIYGPRDS